MLSESKERERSLSKIKKSISYTERSSNDLNETLREENSATLYANMLKYNILTESNQNNMNLQSKLHSSNKS